VVTFLASLGANVLVTDIKTREELADSLDQLKGLRNIEFVLGRHRKEDFIDKDFIVKNPGVPASSPYLTLAREHNIPVETDISLFFMLSPARIIGVTGTKGKSTTASLIYELLKTRYLAFLAGNIGRTPLTILEKADANSLVVLELSSWQLEDLAEFKASPFISVITNIFPDHLNRHKTLTHYIEAKKSIVRFGIKESIAVLNADDPYASEFAAEAKGKIYYFSMSKNVNGAFFQDAKLFFDIEESPIINVSDIALKGEHNLSNIAAAVSVAKIYKVKNNDIQKVLRSFAGMPFRQQFIREVRGVSFYNDTTATMPEAAIAALKRLGPACILIAGGMDKGLDYCELAGEIDKQAKFLVLLPGSASDKIMLGLRVKGLGVRVKEVASMEEAVREAFGVAKSGDTIILSPGAASFNLFKNEFDRGEQFNQIVNSL